MADLFEDSFDPTFLDTDITDEENDDFDPLRGSTLHQDDNYWQSQEQQQEIRSEVGDYPHASDWKDDHPSLIEKTTVSIDRARTNLWKQAKTEITIVRSIFEQHYPSSGNSPSFNELATKIYGPEGRLFQLFQEELKLSYEQFCRFLATFYAASSRSQPASRLLDDNKFINPGMMKKEEYYRVTKKIEQSSGAGRGDDDSLWMELEDCYNSFAKKNFLSKRNKEELSVALDDDKEHFNFSKYSDTHGLKRCRHIKDNVLGHTVHTAGLSGTGFPLCACFEREEETQSQVYERMLKKMFGSRTGNSPPNLQGMCIIIFSKRIVSYCISRIESYSTILFLTVRDIPFFVSKELLSVPIEAIGHLLSCSISFYGVVVMLLVLLLGAFGIHLLL